MNKFYMTIGVAGCGKSTWAQNNLNILFDEIYSSDAYREKLLGDINDQKHNDIVFKELHKDIVVALKEGKSICYDATNLTIKVRSKILNLIEEHNIECEKIAVLFEIHPSIIYRQNSERSRKVPEKVIDDMFLRFEIPFLNEGFDKINYIFRKEENNHSLNFIEAHDMMRGFDQDNPHHTEDLLTHCLNCYSNLDKHDANLELVVASSIHDIGKLWTKTFDEEKGYSHFIGHDNYGAYMSLFIDWYPLIIDKESVAFYINYHMLPYRLANAKDATIEKYKNLFKNEWDNIIKLHNADVSAH